jgi:hypothetical protein
MEYKANNLREKEQNILRLLNDIEETSVNTNKILVEQDNQLNNIHKNVYKVQDNLTYSSRLLKSMKGIQLLFTPIEKEININILNTNTSKNIQENKLTKFYKQKTKIDTIYTHDTFDKMLTNTKNIKESITNQGNIVTNQIKKFDEIIYNVDTVNNTTKKIIKIIKTM